MGWDWVWNDGKYGNCLGAMEDAMGCRTAIERTRYSCVPG